MGGRARHARPGPPMLSARPPPSSSHALPPGPNPSARSRPAVTGPAASGADTVHRAPSHHAASRLFPPGRDAASSATLPPAMAPRASTCTRALPGSSRPADRQVPPASVKTPVTLARRPSSETVRPCWSVSEKPGAGTSRLALLPAMARARIGSALRFAAADAIGAAPSRITASAPTAPTDRAPAPATASRSPSSRPPGPVSPITSLATPATPAPSAAIIPAVTGAVTSCGAGESAT